MYFLLPSRVLQTGSQLPAQESLLENLVLDLRASSKLSDACTNIWVYRARTIVLDFQSNELKFALDLSYSPGAFTGTVLGRSDFAGALLKSALAGKFEMTRSNGERHVLGTLKEAEEYPEKTADQCYKWIAMVKEAVSLQV